jgi:hypothetical protein
MSEIGMYANHEAPLVFTAYTSLMDRIGGRDDRADSAQEFQFSDLEAWILETIENVGWYAYLWFPVVLPRGT